MVGGTKSTGSGGRQPGGSVVKRLFGEKGVGARAWVRAGGKFLSRCAQLEFPSTLLLLGIRLLAVVRNSRKGVGPRKRLTGAGEKPKFSPRYSARSFPPLPFTKYFVKRGPSLRWLR